MQNRLKTKMASIVLVAYCFGTFAYSNQPTNERTGLSPIREDQTLSVLPSAKLIDPSVNQRLGDGPPESGEGTGGYVGSGPVKDGHLLLLAGVFIYGLYARRKLKEK